MKQEYIVTVFTNKSQRAMYKTWHQDIAIKNYSQNSNCAIPHHRVHIEPNPTRNKE